VKVIEMDSLKILARQRRVLELRCKGLTIPQIAARLKDEGGKVSQYTVWKDLHSKIAKDFTEELLRKQLADIANCPDIKTRLKYRSLLEYGRGKKLRRLLPKQRMQRQVNTTSI
jgi:hypothetical protein